MVKREFKVFVEGGAKGNLNTKCRAGFSQFFEKAGLKGRMPKIIACGSRQHAYDDFCIALKNAAQGDIIVLLVDSEEPIHGEQHQVWQHVLRRANDKWPQPQNAQPEHLHFMVECMEAWFLGDKACLEAYFGNGFGLDKLPAHQHIEKIAKADVYEGLEKATKNCKTKAKYGKGAHSFDLLAKINPHKVAEASPYAKRLIDALVGWSKG